MAGVKRIEDIGRTRGRGESVAAIARHRPLQPTVRKHGAMDDLSLEPPGARRPDGRLFPVRAGGASLRAKPTLPCMHYMSAGRRGPLGVGVQADAMASRPARGSIKVNLGDVSARRLLVERKWRCAIAKRVMPKRRED